MSITVTRAGALSTVQDLGRPGFAHLGVPRAGALDLPAAALANRIVGNPADAALIETTMTGFGFTAAASHWFAVTGARCDVRVDGRAVAHGEPVFAPSGAAVDVGPALVGVRSCIAIAGGVSVEPVLGSRATDTLAWVGPPPLSAGMTLPVGASVEAPRPVDTPRPEAVDSLRVVPGPRVDWFDPDALEVLCASTWTVGPDSNRIGLRLAGGHLERSRHGELASEGMVLGAVQVPPSGEPVVFLADHPVTGGYPVLAVVLAEDLHRCAQLRPGEPVRFTRRRAGLG